MARRALFDHLQVFPFWLVDVAPIDSGALPIFNPLSGFSSITAPEITFQLKDIKEANWPLAKKVVQSAEVSNLTLQRGVTFSNSDFWRWTVAAITGNTAWEALFGRISTKVGGKTYRRDLLLIQFFARNPVDPVTSFVETGLDALAGVATAVNPVGGLATQLAAQVLAPFDIAFRIPAKAWLLKGCVPARYKTGSDFDARSGEVSIAEMDVAVESIEEISLATL